MPRESAIPIDLPSLDDLFTTEESRSEAKLERFYLLDTEEISDFPNHPFHVRMDFSMGQIIQSVRENGVLVPALVRPKDGGYQMVSGHRRKVAAELAGMDRIPCIVRDLTDDQATIVMVDSNLHREQILPSEKAFANKMKLDAMRRIAGRPPKENSATVLQNFQGKTSREIVAEQAGESHEQVRKYIRLTYLVPELLELVDNAVLKETDKQRMALRPAVELSYLRKEEQLDLFDLIEEMDVTPSHAQALKLRRLSEGKGPGQRLARDAIVSIMQEEKPNQVEQFKMPKSKIAKFFPAGTPAAKMEETIVKALELYLKRQRDRER